MTTRRVLGLAAVLVLAGAPATAVAGDLIVQVDGLRTRDGAVHLGLYDDGDKFPDRDGRIGGGTVSADGDRITYVFSDLQPGQYAVSLYHDENDNDKFDFTFLGLPGEGYGFSNDAMGFLSSPSFEDAVVAVGEDDTVITINLSY